MNYLFRITIIIIIYILFYIINKLFNNIEKFCKISSLDKQDDKNDKRVLLDYKPQSNISTASYDQYWKKCPLEYNSTMVDDEPLVIEPSQLKLPKEKEFGDNNYKAGFIDYNKLANMINDNNEDIFSISEELLVDPVSKEKLKFKYELEFSYIENNKKTWINRWEEYNPSIKIYFDYNEIISPIEDINILNLEFKKRCDEKQKNLLTNSQLILFGLMKFDIFKYKILNINYFNSDINRPLYIIQIVLYRETELYINTFSYIGYIKDGIPLITNVKYIGRNSNGSMLLPESYNKNKLKENIINTNFDNSVVINKYPSAILAISEKYKEAYKLKNHHACFNLNYDGNIDGQYILPAVSRENCETNYGSYGKDKKVGIYDTPCKEDSDCPFFQVNKNYENNFGKCMEDGYCELPINMERIGYRYYKQLENKLPLCYNCDSNKYNISSNLDNCCQEQYDKTKYPFLKSPDFAFKNDTVERQNYFNTRFCKQKKDSEIICDDFVV